MPAWRARRAVIVRSARVVEIAAGADGDAAIAALIERIGKRGRWKRGRWWRPGLLTAGLLRVGPKAVLPKAVLPKAVLPKVGLPKVGPRAGARVVVIEVEIAVGIGSSRPCRRSATC